MLRGRAPVLARPARVVEADARLDLRRRRWPHHFVGLVLARPRPHLPHRLARLEVPNPSHLLDGRYLPPAVRPGYGVGIIGLGEDRLVDDWMLFRWHRCRLLLLGWWWWHRGRRRRRLLLCPSREECSLPLLEHLQHDIRVRDQVCCPALGSCRATHGAAGGWSPTQVTLSSPTHADAP